MNEVSLSFGAQGHLSATLTLPAKAQPARMGLVLLNVGIIHRMGPHRFNAKLARALARDGLATLRLDLGGQGDSGAPEHSLPFEQQAVADLQAAMDHFQRICDIEQFAIVGICSGAHNALAAALADQRVAALWMLDGHAYPTATTRWNRYAKRLREAPLLTLLTWVRKLARRARLAWRRVAGRSSTQTSWDFEHRAPPREAFGRDVQSLVDRGVALCFVYSGSMRWYYNYPEQLREVFGAFNFVDRVRCEYLPQADHTATTLATQERLIRSVADWLHATLAGDPGTRSAAKPVEPAAAQAPTP